MNDYAIIKARGREIGLFYSVGATIELAELTGGEIEKINDYLNNVPSGEVVKRVVNMIEILNKWYAEDTGTEPVSRKKLLTLLDVSDTGDYVSTILDAINKGTKVTIETKEVKNAESAVGPQLG
jgi:hypothetical protein